MKVIEYNAGTRQGLLLTTPEPLGFKSVRQGARTTNLICFLVRMADTSEQFVSLWTGFSMVTHGNVIVKKDTVRYISTITAPGMQLSTVYEILNQVVKIKNALDVVEIIHVFDPALSIKAAEIT